MRTHLLYKSYILLNKNVTRRFRATPSSWSREEL